MRYDMDALKRRIDDIVNHPEAGREPIMAWYLQSAFGLDATEADLAICGRAGEHGADALYVDVDSKTVYVLQSKERVNLSEREPDEDVGYFCNQVKDKYGSAAKVDSLLRGDHGTVNPDLVDLLREHEVVTCLQSGYTVVGIYLTLRRLSPRGRSQLRQSEGIVSYEGVDQGDLAPILLAGDGDDWIRTPTPLQFVNGAYFDHDTGAGARVVFGLVEGDVLAHLPGIETEELFGQNPRGHLGAARKVNKEIAATIRRPEEHPLFCTFHNGVTIVARSAEPRSSGRYLLNEFSVVNGCQSIGTLHKERNLLVDSSLTVPVRIVVVPTADDLIEKIGNRTNNQNKVEPRDLRATDDRQKWLKREVQKKYGRELVYKVKSGVKDRKGPDGKTVVQMDDAAQLFASLYLGKPWLGHKKPRLFGSDYEEVFGVDPEARKEFRRGAGHLYLAHLLYGEVLAKLLPHDGSCPLGDQPHHREMAKFSQTRYVVLSAVGLYLKQSEDGRDLLDDPEKYLRPGKIDIVKPELARVVAEAVRDLAHYVRQREKGRLDAAGNTVPKDEWRPSSFLYAKETKSEAPATVALDHMLDRYNGRLDDEETRPFSLAGDTH